MDEPSGRPKLGYEEEDEPAELEVALLRDFDQLRGAGVKLDLLSFRLVPPRARCAT